ncbi:putative 28S ribosomal protein S11, mitochondrial [Hypsibius exemplaris]|uniref:28S ribosomal protein S11, mitochondrial n=1 Tax=Hypsibius exemplaris TaxID=2072580 RepID=A0A9X6NQ10_HYPEX|nr:putative 28S ribosomal protein S11, mitochondrial [Hypsibius exemplaris]
MWSSLQLVRLLSRIPGPPLIEAVRVRPFCTSAVNLRRKDLSALRGKLPPEDEGVVGEHTLQVSPSLPQYPNLETHQQIFDGMVYTDLPIIHIKCSQNNTIMSIVDAKTEKITHTVSCGTEGYRNCKKGTNVAGQSVGLSMGKKALTSGQRTFRVTIRGLGPGRASSIKGLEMAGINIISVTDRTPIPNNGNKPRKARRI